MRGDRRVEAPGGLRVADADPQVVDAAGGYGVLAVAVDRLDAVAVGVEQEPAVVRRAVLRARPGAPSSGTPRRSRPARTRRPARGRGRGSRRGARGSPGARGPSARCPSRPTRPARRPHGWARRPGRSGRCGRSARRPRGPRRRCQRGRTPGRGYRRGLDTPEIIEGMQQLALEQRRLLGPRAPWHVGDVAWGLCQHEGREPGPRAQWLPGRRRLRTGAGYRELLRVADRYASGRRAWAIEGSGSCGAGTFRQQARSPDDPRPWISDHARS